VKVVGEHAEGVKVDAEALGRDREDVANDLVDVL
jgi:hypothetical protein